MKLSFGFKKTTSGPKVQAINKRGFEKVEEEKEDIEIITGVDDKGIKGTKPKKEEEKLVIALIKENRWDKKYLEKKKANVSDGATLANAKQFNENPSDEAAAALISDANKFLQIQETKGKRDQGLSIPILMQNKVPEGFEAEEGPLKVDIRPDSSKLEDYDAVPIEQFGLAMLRGMGFKEEEGIGKTKQKVNEVKVEMRPKGLGLGAIPAKKKMETVKADAKEAVLQMKVGAYVRIVAGPYEDRYGIVQSMDGDLGRLKVKWALGSDGPPQEVMEGFTELVTKKQHDEIGRDISRKTKAAKEAARKKEELKRKNESQSSQIPEKRAKSSNKKPAKWCHRGLVIRFTGNKKKSYYKQKFKVVEVISRSEIVCQDLDNRDEREFDEYDLETVIPKVQEVVCVIDGHLKGQLGVVQSKNKDREKVVVKMNDSKKEETLKYDFVCHYTPK